MRKSLGNGFYSENIPPNQIPNKQSDNVYSIYTDYEGDYTGKYFIHHWKELNSLDQIPDGLIDESLTKLFAIYQKFIEIGQNAKCNRNCFERDLVKRHKTA